MGLIFSSFVHKLVRWYSRSNSSPLAGKLEITIDNVDYAPGDLYAQTPFTMTTLRMMSGPDRPDYWLTELHTPLRRIHENHEREITHLVLAARWQGTKIKPGISNLPVGIAYVIDQSLLVDSTLDLSKCDYVAIGLAHDTTDGRPTKEQTKISAGTIGQYFGTGHP